MVKYAPVARTALRHVAGIRLLGHRHEGHYIAAMTSREGVLVCGDQTQAQRGRNHRDPR